MTDLRKKVNRSIAPLIENPVVFTERYKPRDPSFREEENDEIIDGIKLGENRAPINMLVTGSPSTGKTLIMKLLCEYFNDRFEKMGTNTKLIYINLGNSSYYGALVDIITTMDPSFPQHGRPARDVEKSIMKTIDDDEVVGFVLDEADRMVAVPPYKQPIDNLVSTLTRAYEKHGKICFIILIANNKDKVLKPLDDRIVSSLSENTILFKNYSGKQIGEILWERCQKGFKQGAIDEDVVMDLGHRISQTSKDIRVGLKTLKMSALDANEYISREMVDDAYEDAVRDIHKDLVKTLDDTQLLLVHSIAYIQYKSMRSPSASPPTNANVYDNYNKTVKQAGIEQVKSKHLFNYILPKVQGRGIVSSYTKSFGRGKGRKKVMSCAESEEDVEKIVRAAEEEISNRFNE